MNPRIILAAVLLAAVPAAAAAAAPTAPPSPAAHTNNGLHKGQIKKMQTGSLTTSQAEYALSHAAQTAQKLHGMGSIHFDHLRLYKLPASLEHLIKGHASASTVAYEPMLATDTVAQTTGSWLNLIADVNVVDALNNTLNNNTVSVSLQDVLNSNNVALGQVVGLYIDSAGIITTVIH